MVANTHILFNPKRGDIKLAQVMLTDITYIILFATLANKGPRMIPVTSAESITFANFRAGSSNVLPLTFQAAAAFAKQASQMLPATWPLPSPAHNSSSDVSDCTGSSCGICWSKRTSWRSSTGVHRSSSWATSTAPLR